jgi:iduronate 2-sulfatase
LPTFRDRTAIDMSDAVAGTVEPADSWRSSKPTGPSRDCGDRDGAGEGGTMKMHFPWAALCAALWTTGFAWTGTASAQAASTAAPPTSAPKYNVLFLISDDLRAELGSYGGLAKTPNLDALAAKGVRFERAYCQYPLCNPSRASMLTGTYPITNGVIGNRDDWKTGHPDWLSLPGLFKANGIPSLRTGKIFHGIASLDDPNGWTEGGANQGGGVEPEGADPQRLRTGATQDAPLPPQARPLAKVTPPADGSVDHNAREYLLAGSGRNPGQSDQQARSDQWRATDDGPDGGTAGSTRQAVDYLRRYKDKQFFLAVGYSKPHSPLVTSLRFFQEYDWNQIPLPIDYQPKVTLPAGFPEGSIRRNNTDLFIGRDSTPESARDMIRAYLACVSSVDFNVGQVLGELDRQGLADKTIVVFWGDHGFQLGEKGKWSKAGSLWEQGARVPTFIYVPGLPGMGKSRIVESVDLYRTLADLTGLKVQDHVEGRSLVPLLKDPTAPWDHPAYTIWSEDGRTLTGISVRNEKYRYAEFTAGAGGAMLLDQEKDPHELKNVVDDPAYAAARADLSRLVAAYRTRFQAAK